MPLGDICSTIVLIDNESDVTPIAPLQVLIPEAIAVAAAAESVIKSLDEEVLHKPITENFSKFDQISEIL